MLWKRNFRGLQQALQQCLLVPGTVTGGLPGRTGMAWTFKAPWPLSLFALLYTMIFSLLISNKPISIPVHLHFVEDGFVSKWSMRLITAHLRRRCPDNCCSVVNCCSHHDRIGEFCITKWVFQYLFKAICRNIPLLLAITWTGFLS